jgi:hypothetical protein
LVIFICSSNAHFEMRWEPQKVVPFSPKLFFLECNPFGGFVPFHIQNGPSLGSFIGLLTFYNIYCSFFEIRVKPLRALEREHHRKPIPPLLWTPPLVDLWDELKISITSSPCLARYDSSLPCFLKTDWAGTGMGWILMQPDNSEASIVALALLHSDGICTFDLTMNGACLRPVRFGSRSCNAILKDFWHHSRLICSTSDIPSKEKVQYGGTRDPTPSAWVAGVMFG